jgi:hypothetical protein
MATIDDKHTVLDTNDARGGAETGTVRWVLRISLGLAVLAGLVIYLSFFHHL